MRGVSALGRFGLACVAWASLFGCGDADVPAARGLAPLVVPAGCNPIAAQRDGGGDCLLPFPSDVYRAKDAGGRFSVRIPEAAEVHVDDAPIDPFELHRPDGFSWGSPILVRMPSAVDSAALPKWTAPEPSLDADSPTLLVDAETGERVLHFAELDPRADDPARQALILRPLVRLASGRRYVVGLRDLKTPAGAPVPAPDGFAALRDGQAASTPGLAELAARYDADVFAVLSTAGAPRASLQLAWDFTTQSEEAATADLLAVRNDVLERLAAEPVVVEVTEVRDDYDEHTARRIEATITVPLYLESAEPGAALRRGAGGEPVAEGTASVPVSIWIPRSVAARAPGDPPARLLQYGHGFFGSREEVDSFASTFADERGFVVVAADWWGMSDADRGPVVSDLVNEPAKTTRFVDRVHQAMANFLALAEAATGPLATLPELAVQGVPAYDPSAIYFYGISQGHVLGSTYVALSPRIERAALSVGGANLSMIMFRSRAFLGFLAFVQTRISDPLEQQKFTALLQPSFDRVDPLTYAPYLLEGGLEGAPASRRIVQQMGVGDAAMPNLASELQARVLGLPLLAPSSLHVPLLELANGPIDGSALVVFDFHTDPPASGEAIPPIDDNEVHEGVRRLEASKEQIDRLLRPGGLVESTCDGPCDPE